MPWAMLQLREHLALALTMCVLLGLWSCYTMVLLYDCVVLAWPEAHGYSELVVKALGAPGGVLCAVNLVLHQILCVAAYLVFVADSLKDVFGGTTAVYIAGQEGHEQMVELLLRADAMITNQQVNAPERPPMLS